MNNFHTDAVLTADDVKALRQAEKVVFRMTQGQATIEAGLGDMLAEPRAYTGAQRRVFPELSTGSSDRERTIEVSGSVRGSVEGGFDSLAAHTGFAMLHTAQYTPTWTTIASLLRVGDALMLVFDGDAHTDENLRKARMHGDVLRLRVRRPNGRVLTFDVASSTGPDNTARMVRA